jgi:hypothetical protein
MARSAIEAIRLLLDSGVVSRSLTVVPDGATEQDLQLEERILGLNLCEDYKAFLRQWNGANVEVATFYGCGQTHPEIPRVTQHQEPWAKSFNGIVIGGDPAGFVYVQLMDCRILVVDTDGGTEENVAANFDDFVGRFMLGPDAESFGGSEWKEELRDAGLL